MKTVLTLTTAALLALPLSAGEPQKTTGATTAPAPAATPDSPLVAAAKRSKAARKKTSGTVVITDATLAKSSGTAHITTSATVRPIVVLPPAPPSRELETVQAIAKQKQVAAEKEAKRKQDEDAMRLRMAANNEEAEDNYPGPTPPPAPPPPPQ